MPYCILVMLVLHSKVEYLFLLRRDGAIDRESTVMVMRCTLYPHSH